MSDRSPTAAVLGGAVVVLLSGVAAYVGAGLARRDPAPAVPPPASSGVATAEANERRFGFIEKRLDLVEQTSRTALDLARAHAPASQGGDAPPPDAARPDSEAPRPADPGAAPAAAEPDRNDGADGQMAQLVAVARGTAKGRVVYAMSLLTDATQEGIANRTAQALADAHALAHLYGVKDEDAQEEIRKVFRDQWDRGARDIGPIVHDGLEKADIATVRERLATIYADTDKRLRTFFDDETWKRYEAAAAGQRKADGAVLDEFEKVRLGGR